MQVTDILVRSNVHIKTFMLAALLLFVGSACGELSQKESRQVNQALGDSLLSTTETWNLDMELMEEGRKKIRLQGSYAASFNNRDVQETRISGPVDVHVFDTEGKIKTWVYSDSAIYHSDDTEFELFGDVRVQTRDGSHLESEYLIWKEAENKISTPEFVIITTPSDSIAGTGFNGASDLSTYTIKNTSGRVVLD